MKVENQEPSGDRSQNDPCPEVDASVYQTVQPMDSEPEEASCDNLILKADQNSKFQCLCSKLLSVKPTEQIRTSPLSVLFSCLVLSKSHFKGICAKSDFH